MRRKSEDKFENAITGYARIGQIEKTRLLSIYGEFKESIKANLKKIAPELTEKALNTHFSQALQLFLAKELKTVDTLPLRLRVLKDADKPKATTEAFAQDIKTFYDDIQSANKSDRIPTDVLMKNLASAIAPSAVTLSASKPNEFAEIVRILRIIQKRENKNTYAGVVDEVKSQSTASPLSTSRVSVAPGSPSQASTGITEESPRAESSPTTAQQPAAKTPAESESQTTKTQAQPSTETQTTEPQQSTTETQTDEVTRSERLEQDEEIERLKTQLAESQSTIELLKAQIELEKAQRISGGTTEAENKTLKDALAEAIQRATTAESASETQQAQIQNLEEQVNTLQTQLTTATGTNATQTTEINSLNTQLGNAITTATEAETRIADLTQELAQTKTQLANAQTDASNAKTSASIAEPEQSGRTEIEINQLTTFFQLQLMLATTQAKKAQDIAEQRINDLTTQLEAAKAKPATAEIGTATAATEMATAATETVDVKPTTSHGTTTASDAATQTISDAATQTSTTADASIETTPAVTPSPIAEPTATIPARAAEPATAITPPPTTDAPIKTPGVEVDTDATPSSAPAAAPDTTTGPAWRKAPSQTSSVTYDDTMNIFNKLPAEVSPDEPHSKTTALTAAINETLKKLTGWKENFSVAFEAATHKVLDAKNCITEFTAKFTKNGTTQTESATISLKRTAEDNGKTTWTCSSKSPLVSKEMRFTLIAEQSLQLRIKELDICKDKIAALQGSTDPEKVKELRELEAKRDKFNPHEISISVAAKGPEKEHTLAGQKFNATDEQKTAIEAYLKAGFTTVQFTDKEGKVFDFTKDGYQVSLSKPVTEAKVDDSSNLKTKLLAELKDFLDNNPKIPASTPPVTPVASAGQDTHNRCVAAAEKMHEEIAKTSPNDVNKLAEIVNTTKISKPTLSYSECYATCENLCKKAQNELKATGPAPSPPTAPRL